MSADDEYRGFGFVMPYPAAFDKLADKYALTASERLTLVQLRDRVDCITCCVAASIRDVVKWTGLSENTVRANLKRFEKIGLTAMREPFRQHGKGVVELLVHDDLMHVSAKHRALREESAADPETPR